MICLGKRKWQLVAISFVFLLSISFSKAQDTRYSVKMAESIISRSPSGYGSWDYVTGTVLRGMEEVWRVTGDEKYYNYIKQTVDNVISSDGNISGYSLSSYNIDEIKEGCQLLLLYKQTGQEKYKIAADKLREQLEGHPRTTRGGFWHKQVYPWQMWLDGLYMGSPFYAEYSELFGDEDGLDDVVLQITEVDTHTYDPVKKLFYHGWDESLTQAWADPVTGCNESFWGRAIGWYAMAIVDVLDYLPQDHPGRDTAIGIFNRLAEGIALYQDPDTLVWWQVVDRGRDLNNYIESSASCMYTYALAKGVRLGYIDKSYKQFAIDGFQGIVNNFITENSGVLSLTQTCSSAGLGGNPYRAGDYDYYTLTAGYITNDGKGLGPFLLAALEIEMLDSIYPPGNLYTDSLNNDGIYLSWFDNSWNESGFELERKTDGGFVKIADLSSGTMNYADEDITSLTTYTYRIKAVNASVSSGYSNKISITTPNISGVPWQVTNLTPADGSKNLSLDTILKWDAAYLAESYNVYFGTTNPPSFVANTTAKSFDPGELMNDTSYFWRVDAVNSSGTTEGDVLSFSTPKRPQLVGYWNFSEDSGSTIIDSTKYANHGTWYNMDESNRVFGYHERALYFHGINEYVEIPHNDILNFSVGSFTICFYLKQPSVDISTSKEFRYIIKGSHTYNASSGSSGKRYEIFSDAGEGDMRFVIDDNSNKTALRVKDLASVMKDDWVHIACVRDADEHKLYMYLDGELFGSEDDITGDISENETLYFGYAPEKGAYLHGKLDEVRMYNTALSQSQVQDIIEAPIIDNEVSAGLTVKSSMRIYPNPTTSTVTINTMKEFQRVNIELVDLCGKTILQKQLHDDENQLNLSKLTKGIYLLKLEIEGEVLVQKLILQ